LIANCFYMRYAFILLALLLLISCSEHPKTKTADNTKAVQDTNNKIDTKKKTLLNNRY